MQLPCTMKRQRKGEVAVYTSTLRTSGTFNILQGEVFLNITHRRLSDEARVVQKRESGETRKLEPKIFKPLHQAVACYVLASGRWVDLLFLGVQPHWHLDVYVCLCHESPL